jgi:hypothetical protein
LDHLPGQSIPVLPEVDLDGIDSTIAKNQVSANPEFVQQQINHTDIISGYGLERGDRTPIDIL